MESPAPAPTTFTPPVPVSMTAQSLFKPFTSVKFSADFANLSFSGVGTLDSGSNVILVPENLLPDQVLSKITPTTTTVNGVGGANTVRGEFSANVTLGQARFDQIRFLVTQKSKLPILLGNPILKEDSVVKYTVDRERARLTFERQIDGSRVEQSVQISEKHTVPIPVEVSPSFGQCLATDTRPPPPSLDINAKLAWLKEHVGVALTHPNQDELSACADLLIEFSDVFGDESCLGRFPHEVDIPTEGPPINAKQHPIAQAFESCVDAEIAKMEQNGIIERVEDSKGWCTPILVVKKKDGSPRVCMNFKVSLNRRLVEEETYVQRSAEELFRQIEPNAKFFSSMDLARGYWQLVLKPSVRHKTAFQWGAKKYQYVRLPFGLKTAGAIFCKAVGRAFEAENFNPRRIVNYLDDVSVHSPDFKSFLESHRKIFSCLRRFNLRLNAKKCQFLRPEIEFLGRLISAKGMRPNPAYVEGMLSLEAPKNKAELRQLIGRLVWLKQFVATKMNASVKLNSFSHMMEDIFACNRGKSFEWTDAAEAAYNKLKRKLSSRPFISLADPKLDFVLTTDASDAAAGAVLMQRAAESDYRVVATVSHTFSGSEKNWAVCVKEAFAIYWSIRKLDYFLAGRPFVVHTDHRSLCYIDTVTFKNPMIARWQSELSEYSFSVQYIQGVDNVWADWLSRGASKKKKAPPADTDFKPKGRFLAVANSPLRIYLPSWVEQLVKPNEKGIMQLKPVDNECNVTNRSAMLVQVSSNESADALLGPCSMLAKADVSEEAPLFPHLTIAEAQRADSFYEPIINAINVTKGDRATVEQAIVKAMKSDDNRYALLRRLVSRLKVDYCTGVLYLEGNNGPRVVLPESLIAQYLETAHHSMGHPGAERTLAHLSTVWWQRMADDVKQFVQSCRLCAGRKGNIGARAVPAGTNVKGNYPMQVLYLDFVVMDKAKNGLRYVLTIIDSFSRYLGAYASRGCSAQDAAKGLVHFVATHGGPPSVISTDRGVHFTADVFKRTCEALNIKHQLHCAWRPQSTAVLERAHRTLKNSLYISSVERKLEWPQVLHLVVCSMNGQANKSTKRSPFEVLTGRPYTLAMPNVATNSAESAEQYAQNVSAELKSVFKAVRLCSQEADDDRRHKVNKNPTRSPLRPGDMCLLYRPDSRKKDDKHFPWIGDFVVLETNGLVFRVKCSSSGIIDWVSCHHVRPLPVRDKRLRRMSECVDAECVVVDKGRVAATTKAKVSTIKREPLLEAQGARDSSSSSAVSHRKARGKVRKETTKTLKKFFTRLSKKNSSSSSGNTSSKPGMVAQDTTTPPPPTVPKPPRPQKRPRAPAGPSATSTPVASEPRRSKRQRVRTTPFQHAGYAAAVRYGSRLGPSNALSSSFKS